MITSSELRRRIAPTGQPTMHSGSRHWRQDVATRKFSKRSPSRTRRVTPSCESAQAVTQASQRVHFSRSRTSRLCASINPCARKSLERHAAHHAQAFAIGFLAFSRDIFQAAPHIGKFFHHGAKIFRGDANQFDVVERRAGRGPRAAAEQADFAEIIAARQIGQHQFAAGIFLGNFHKSQPHQIKTVGGFALLADHLAGRESHQFDAVAEVVDEILREAAKNRNIAQVRIERAPAIGLVQLRAKGFAFLQDVENVAQHLEHGAIGFRAHRCGARIIIHAGHFAEEFARAELRDGMVVGQIDGRVDRNRPAVVFFFAAIFLPAARRLVSLLVSFRKIPRAALRFYVGNGAGQLNAGLAFQNIKCGRAEFALRGKRFRRA